MPPELVSVDRLKAEILREVEEKLKAASEHQKRNLSTIKDELLADIRELKREVGGNNGNRGLRGRLDLLEEKVKAMDQVQLDFRAGQAVHTGLLNEIKTMITVDRALEAAEDAKAEKTTESKKGFPIDSATLKWLVPLVTLLLGGGLATGANEALAPDVPSRTSIQEVQQARQEAAEARAELKALREEIAQRASSRPAPAPASGPGE